MVEFALVLPLLVLLMLLSFDFGRVFFSWVGLQDAARTGAEMAAGQPSSWALPDGNGFKDFVRERYQAAIRENSSAFACSPPISEANGNLPDPDFTGYELGDEVTVELDCQFPILTPFVQELLGGSVTIHGDAVYTVRRTLDP